VDGHADPNPASGADVAPGSDSSSDELLDQAPVIPFRLAIRAAEQSSSEDDATPPAPATPAGPPTDVAAVVAAAMLFLSPTTAAVTGQVVRVNPARTP
jgi:hypothetical protein